MQTIMMIDDDNTLLQTVIKNFAKWSLKVVGVSDFQKIIAEFKQLKPDLVIMDINLPYFDGFYWAQQLRQISTVPLLFLSAIDQETSMLRALAEGGDDYVIKPFTISILLAKVQAMLRRLQTYDQQVQSGQLQFGPYTLYTLGNEVVFNQQRVNLSPTEGDILQLLFLNVNQVISTQHFLETFWQGGLFLDEQALRVNFSRLRRKLKPIDLQQYIVTEPGSGYRLCAYE